MEVDELSKRVAVAVAGPGDNRRVALLHSCYFDGIKGDWLVSTFAEDLPFRINILRI